jgi:hypothetical protein
MFEPPPPFEPSPPQAAVVRELKPSTRLLSPEERDAERLAEARREAARRAAERLAEAHREAARQVATFLEAAREVDRQDGAYYTANLDTSGGLWLRAQDRDGNVIGQPLMIANMWDVLTERRIKLLPQGSEVVRFTIGEQLVVRVNVTLYKKGFLGFGRELQLLPSLEVEWKAQEALRELSRKFASWGHEYLSESGHLTIRFYDSTQEEIHKQEINVFDELDAIGLKLRPRQRTILSFAVGEDLMQAKVELEVGFLWFRRKLTLLSLVRKRGEAWRLRSPEERKRLLRETESALP